MVLLLMVSENLSSCYHLVLIEVIHIVQGIGLWHGRENPSHGGFNRFPPSLRKQVKPWRVHLGPPREILFKQVSHVGKFVFMTHRLQGPDGVGRRGHGTFVEVGLNLVGLDVKRPAQRPVLVEAFPTASAAFGAVTAHAGVQVVDPGRLLDDHQSTSFRNG